MKRLFAVLLIGLLVLGLVACGGDKKTEQPKEEAKVEQSKEDTKEASAEQKKAEEQQKAVEGQQKALVEAAKKTEEEKQAAEETTKKAQKGNPEEQIKDLIKDLLPNLAIQEPDSLGEVYAVATYENITSMPIVTYEAVVTLADINESTYFVCPDTVLPGTKSPNFSSFGPKSGKIEDIKINTLSITVMDSQTTFTTFDYDVKLDKLTGYSFDASEKSPIDVSKLIPNLTLLPPDSIEEVYVEGELENTTDLPITGYSLKYLNKDSNEISYLSFYETVLPGETSAKFSSFGPKTGDLKDMEPLRIEVLFHKEDGKTLNVQYDILLDYSSFDEY